MRTIPYRVSEFLNARLNMKIPIKGALQLLVVATLAVCSLASLAMPKAAENEDAPVTTIADVARPRLSAKPAKRQMTVKSKKAAKRKAASAGKPSRKAKAVKAKSVRSRKTLSRSRR
jgi:hypothetical protein